MKKFTQWKLTNVPNTILELGHLDFQTALLEYVKKRGYHPTTLFHITYENNLMKNITVEIEQ